MAFVIYIEGALHISFMNKLNNVQKGKIGEDKAAKYLARRFYKILEKNYRRKTGEIDIIAKKSGYIIFIEVKYRKNLSKGLPREAVTPYKQGQIRRTANMYIAENNIDSPMRFDVIEIIDNHIEHIENAF